MSRSTEFADNNHFPADGDLLNITHFPVGRLSKDKTPDRVDQPGGFGGKFAAFKANLFGPSKGQFCAPHARRHQQPQ